MSHLRRNLRLAAALLLVADLGLAAWLLSPRAPSQSATRQQLTAARAQLIALRAEVAQLGQLRGRIATSRQQMQELMDQGMPQQSEASSALLAEFSRVAAASGVQVSGARFEPDKDAQLGLRRVAISLEVAGGYRGVVTFLNQLERSPLFFLINQVSVSGGRAAGPGTGDAVKLEVRLEAYELIGAGPRAAAPLDPLDARPGRGPRSPSPVGSAPRRLPWAGRLCVSSAAFPRRLGPQCQRRGPRVRTAA